MNKKTNSKRLLIDYLISRPDETITREEIIQDTGISKSRLSELINDLRADGYEIQTPNRSGKVQLKSNKEIVQNVTPKEIRQWLIILALSKLGSATYLEIVCSILSIADSTYLYHEIKTDENYSDMDILEYLKEFNSAAKEDIDFFLPLPTLRKDLHALIEKGLIDKKRIMHREKMHVVYSISEQAPSVLFESEDELYDFMMFYDNFKKSLSNNETLDSIYKKIFHIYDWESYDSVTHIYGKSNKIDKNQLTYLKNFIQHPYKSKSLNIQYMSRNGELNISIDSGLLFHSIETNRFYLLCINISNREVMPLRLDRMITIQASKRKNKHFRSHQFLNIYEEMFSASYEPRIEHVKILFQDFGNIKERLNSLNAKRRHSSLYEIEPISPDIPHTIIYEDDIRGISDFSRFLRSFGNSALVIEPLELRELMIQSYKQTLHNYEV